MAPNKIEDLWMISGAVEMTAPSIAPVPMIRHNAEQAWMIGRKKDHGQISKPPSIPARRDSARCSQWRICCADCNDSQCGATPYGRTGATRFTSRSERTQSAAHPINDRARDLAE